MSIAVQREPHEGERRVAATPESVRQLVASGLAVTVETGAGLDAGHPDAAYEEAGAAIAARLDLATADALLHVRPLSPATIAQLPAGAVTVGLASPATELPSVVAARDAKVTAFALELVPRISRAQSMDALTSQSLVSGFRSVLEAATRYPRFFPLFMTAAGTIPPARVLVLGAGVAGLQAIATAKRLGAKVSAYDVRAASADEVRSMGGVFIELELDTIEGVGGYAREQTADRAQRQMELLAPHVADADVLITTAAIPGRPAPLLVTTRMVQGMRGGSVVVDLAAESGGNVEGSKPGEDVTVPGVGGDVVIHGLKDPASQMPSDASRLYAKNVANFLALLTVDGGLDPEADDEIVRAARVTHAGEVVHAPTAEALAAEGSE